MIAAFLKIKTRPGKQQKFIEFLVEEGDALGGAEPGTLRFDVFADGENQTLLYEGFADEAAFEAHKDGEYYQRGHGDLSEECVESVEVLMRLRAANWFSQ